jgi:hypothetical protein
MRGEVRAGYSGRAWGGGGASGTHGEGPAQGLGARARAERTSNMRYMVVTLEVSKLSGWLKAYAACRVEREEHAIWGEVRAGRRWVVARRKRVCTRRRSDSRLGGQGTRGAHEEHVAHGRDAGGVKAQRLVEGVRALPSQKGGACDAVRAVRREAGGRGAAARRKRRACARGKGPTQGLGVQGTRGAHVEHADHGRDLGGVKAQRLVEGVRGLPSRKGGACDMGRGEGREAVGSGAAQAAMHSG